MFKKITIIFILLFQALPAFAEADGPDFFAVKDVAERDVLNIRALPHYKSEKVGEIPFDGRQIKNLGCLKPSMGEIMEMTDKERQEIRKKIWCHISFEGIEGYVAAWYLREDAEEYTNSIINSDSSKVDQEQALQIYNDGLLAYVALKAFLQVADESKNTRNMDVTELKVVIDRDWFDQAENELNVGISRFVPVSKIETVQNGIYGEYDFMLSKFRSKFLEPQALSQSKVELNLRAMNEQKFMQDKILETIQWLKN